MLNINCLPKLRKILVIEIQGSQYPTLSPSGNLADFNLIAIDFQHNEMFA